jgi:hypothetical protein
MTASAIATKESALRAFGSLLGVLRVPAPLLAALAVALVIGSKTVKIQSFELSQLHAAVVAIVLLMLMHLACYRAALTLLRLVVQLKDGNLTQFRELRLRITSDSSIYNPFASTISASSSSESSDYLGIIALHVPIAIVLITGTWAARDYRRSAQDAVAVMHYVKSELAEQQSARDTVALVGRMEQALHEARGVLLIASVYGVAVYPFLLLYGAFLIRVGQVSRDLNPDDFTRRKQLLAFPFAVLAIVLLTGSFLQFWHLHRLLSPFRPPAGVLFR